MKILRYLFWSFILLTFVQQGLSQDDNFFFLGTTREGGDDDGGVVFLCNREAQDYDVLYNFKKEDYQKPIFSNVCEYSDYFFGMVWAGGSSGGGGIFKINKNNNNYTKLADFDSETGRNPWGSLTVANDKLYGLIKDEGSFSKGTLIEYNPADNTLTKKLDFNGTGNGGIPIGTLLNVDDNLYGVTTVGGSHGLGVLFKYDPVADILTVLHNFKGHVVQDGSTPTCDLMKASNGKLYGMTKYGGANDNGALFEYDIENNSCSVKHSFLSSSTGKNPWSGKLVEGPEGKLWGTTMEGGTKGKGVIFRYNFNTGNLVVKHHFKGGKKGGNPGGQLVMGNDGKLYGVTEKGGEEDNGVIFKYVIDSNYIKTMYHFDGPNGSLPAAGLIEKDTFLYGTTKEGGENGYGVFFKFDIKNKVYSKIFDFDGESKGKSPMTRLLLVNDTIYGITEFGGANDMGVLYMINTTENDSYTKLHDFDGVNTGKYPRSKLSLNDDGNVVGITHKGGAFDKGVVFIYNPNENTLINSKDMDSDDGVLAYYNELLPFSVDIQLPIELLKFEAKKNINYNIIDWKLADVSTTENVTLETRHEFSSWKPLVEYDDFSNLEFKYLHYDYNNINYYRLKFEDYDGIVSYSDLILIERSDETSSWKFFPNPTSDVVNMSYTGNVNNSEICIYSKDGKLLEKIKTNKKVSKNNIKIDLSSYETGVYIISVKNQNITKVKKILKID